MEARLMARMDAMEARLMTRLNDAQERLTERLRVNEVSVASLVEIGRTTNTLLTTIAGMLTDLGRRVTDLEKEKLAKAGPPLASAICPNERLVMASMFVQRAVTT